MNPFLRISIVLTILAVFGVSISGVLHQKARQEKIKELVTQIITSQDPYKKANAADTLIKLNAKEAIPQITKLLQDNDPDVRRSAVWALGNLGAKEAIPQIIRLLQDTNLAVLESAAWALGQLGAKEAIPDITKLLLNNDKNVASFIHASIIYALGKLDARESIPELVKALDHNGGFIRGLTAVVLIEFGVKDKIPAEAIEDIKILLEYPNKDISARAREALKALGVAEPEEKK